MPTFGPVTISDTLDNGYQDVGASVWTPSYILIGDGGGGGYNSGFRWLNVTVPQGATVSSATLHIRARNAVTGTITNVHTRARGHKGNAPQWLEGTFEADAAGPGFVPTTAQPDWDPSVWVVDDYYDINITTVVQEIINGTWASGNAMAIALLNDASTTGNNAQAYSQADGDATANTITIIYTTGSGLTVIGRSVLND